MPIELQGNVHVSELGRDKETLGGYCGRANTPEELCGFEVSWPSKKGVRLKVPTLTKAVSSKMATLLRRHTR